MNDNDERTDDDFPLFMYVERISIWKNMYVFQFSYDRSVWYSMYLHSFLLIDQFVSELKKLVCYATVVQLMREYLGTNRNYRHLIPNSMVVTIS